ncbi:hypothetical protein J2S74_004775 [Evansella vedderi]|uniref:GK1464-like domain-containing protein n=1 Tax=Evansella vedderi TaxID=38282 RepID=A0ABU0A1F1_9BACI|nr:DUF5634 family protein [Evansella vedderi]MDQ0257317.1 hypothetical protein [Evansella vedderi]
MEYISRDTILDTMTDTFSTKMEQYDLDEIGIFEEHGEGDLYYIGYRVRKNDETFMVHQAYKQNDEGHLTPASSEWVIESESGDFGEFTSLDEVFRQINDINH